MFEKFLQILGKPKPEKTEQQEKERSFIGNREPYEELKTKSRELAQKAARVEEEETQARRLGDTERANKLKTLRTQLMKEQQLVLQKAAEAKKYKLAE